MNQNPDLLLINGFLIDGNGGTPIRNASIGICNGKITYIATTEEQQPMTAKITIDLHGASVMPGLINVHTHAGFKHVNGQVCRDFHEEYLMACIKEGITTIRDEGMLCDSSLQEVMNKKRERDAAGIYPRILTTGKFFSAPGGYGGQAPIAIKTVEQAREKVNEVLDLGIDMIKTVLEDGMDPSTFGLPKLSDELLQAICSEAHTRGAKVSAHVTQAYNLLRLVDAGIDDAAHMVYDPLSDELIQRMVNKGIYIIPTLTVLKLIQDKYSAPLLEQGKENLRRFVQAGGKIAFGDDFIEEEQPWYRWGMPYMELQLLAEAGLSPMEIISAATKNSAEVCGMAKLLGTLEVGKLSDILVVEENPLENLDNIRKVLMVIKDGNILLDHRPRQ